MLYKNINQQIEIILTKSCTWNCLHCLYSPDYKVNLTISKITKHLPYIVDTLSKLNNFSICLVGGEIGLVPCNMLSEIFNILSNGNKLPIFISTNGEFLYNGYHLIFDKYIYKIFWHFNDDLRYYYHNNINININNKIHFGKVFNRIEQVKPYLDNIIVYNNIILDYLSFDLPLYSINNKSQDEILSMYNYLLSTVQSYYSNIISNDCIQDIKNKIHLLSINNNLEDSRKACSELNETISIDLEDEVIWQCSGRSHNKIELNEDNLISMLLPHNNLFNNYNKYCDSCIPWCIEKNKSNILKVKLDNLRRLNNKRRKLDEIIS